MDRQILGMIVLGLTFFYTVGTLIVASIAYGYGRNPIKYIIMSLLTTPIISFIIVVYKGMTKEEKQRRLDLINYRKKINEPSDGRWYN